MNLVEKRHSSRRSSGHRKHSDGGYSDTSSGGSFLDEMDREVRNLTDRAFRSLCIGDEAIYNDSDLSASSPSMQTERQQAFCQSGQDWNREKMKRGAQESYGLQLQQYGQEWTHEMGETQGDTCWAGNVDGRTVGQESATFQHALMDGSLHQRTSVNKEPLSLLSNGAREFGTHERRSRSRVSTLIKAFNSDGYRDGAGPDSKLMEQNNDANWDKSALMSIQREISEISTAYGQNLNSGPFSPAGPFSPQESYYSSQVATAQIDSSSSSSFMRSSHSQHSMSSLYSSSSNVFVHSEFSPFRVWQAHERFPFQHGDVSGYMHSSDFQKWYETPLYEELSLGPETHHVPMHEQWVAETPLRKPLEHVTSPPVPRSSSTSSVLHKASAVQKRCESESAEFHNMRKRTRSLGTNRLPPQQPSTVSPTNEISRPGRDTTLNSITDLQHKFKMMTSEQSVATEMMGNMHGILYSSDHFTQFTNSNTATIMAGEQFVDSNTRTTPFNMNHSHMPGSYPHQDVRTSEVHQCVLSPPAMEHPPVRAESRGGTPDIRLSSYKTRATSLLFNLKDNRKRVKSTYSPPKFKGRENFDRNKPCIRNDCIEPRDTVINIPEFQDSDLQVPQVMVQQGPSVGSHLTQAYGVQCNNISGDYLAPPTQSEMFSHTGFNSYSKYTSSPLTHGHVQQPEDLSLFANNMHANNMSTTGTLEGDAYRQENANKCSISNMVNIATSLQPETIYPATDVSRLNVDNTNQTAYQMNMATEYFNESLRGEMTHVDRYEQVKDNKYAFTDLSSHDSWKHRCQNKETPCVNDHSNPQRQPEAPLLTQKYQNAHERMDMLTDMSLSQPQKYGSSIDWNMKGTKAQDMELNDSKAEGFPVYPQKDVFHTPYHTLVNRTLSKQPDQVQQYSTQSVPGVTAASESELPKTSPKYGLNNQQHGIKENQSKHTKLRSTEHDHDKQKSYGHAGLDNYVFTQESPESSQQIQPESSQQIQPESSQQIQLESSQQIQPESSQQIQPESSQQIQPESSQQIQPESSQQLQQESSQQIQPESSQQIQQESSQQIQLESSQQIQPESSQQIQPESSQQIQPESRQQIQPESRQQIQPESNQQIQPESSQQIQPESSQQIQPESSQQIQPECSQQIQPESSQQIQPESSQQIQPESSQQIQLESSQQIQLESSQQIQLESSQQIQPESSQQIQPESRQQIQLESSQQIQPESSQQIQPESSQQIQPESSQQIQLESSQQIQPESSQQIQQDAQVIKEDHQHGYRQDSVKQQSELHFKEKTLRADKMQCNANPPFLTNQEQDKQYVNVKEMFVPDGKTKENQQLEWAQTLQTKLESVRAGLMEDAVSCGATEEQKEPTTERMVGGQPHVEETITDKLNAVQSKDAHTQEEEEDRLVKTQQAEKDQGIKSQHNKDVLTMVGLKERSTAGEAEIEEAPKEWIKTIEISPDGNAKGEVLAWRELGAEPAKEGQKQAEQIPAGVIKTKQSELDAKAPSEHIKAQLSKTGMEKAKLPKMEETKAVHIKVDDGIKEKGKDELLRSERINAEPSKVEKVKDLFRTKPVQAEKAKVSRETAKEEPNKAVTARDEQTNAEQARIERSQIEHAKAKRAISEKRMQHSVESLLIRKTEKEKLKQEPDKVEKVKMELAKAKAELAKVKDKMREEQKQKQSRHPIVSKLVDKYVLQEEKKPPQYQQRTEETPVRVPVDEYERLGEKYVFNKTALTNKIPITNPSSANDITSPSQEIERSPPHSDEGEEASDNNKPRDEEHPQGKAATKDKKRKPSVKHEELGENQYVYSESSKEFKLSNPNDSSSTLVTKQTEEICIDNNNKDKVMNTKPEPVSANVDSSQLRVFNMNPTKSFTHERKANPNKDTHSTPSRTLTHKERTQTKQQILTSKIKAHAEKEISAIKEKHSASGKGLQQRTPSQEGTKTLDKHIPSGHAPRDQQARVQVKSSLRNSVATPPVWSSNATMPPVLDSQVQKEEPLCVVKDTGTQQLKEVNQTKNNDNSNEELKQRENKPATKAMSQIKEQNPRSPGKEEVMRVNYIHQAAPQKPKADPPSKPEDEAHQTTDVAMWDTQEGPEFAPLMNLVLGQSEAPAAADDDSLQIMGIRVTVRARPETGSITDGNEAPEEAKIDSEANDNIKLPASLAFKTTKENIALRISNSLASQSTVGIEHTKVGANNHLENEPEESTDCLENKMADKRLTTHKESSLMRKTSHSHPVHQEDPVAAKEDSSMVIKPAPNKPGKTQPILFKQGKITEKAKTETNLNKKCIEAKSKIKVNVEVGTDPSLAKETGLYSQMIPVKSDIKSCKMQSHPASLKCQVTDHVTSTKTDQVHDGGCVPLLVDKRTHPSLPEVDPEPQNSSSPNLKGYENVPISLGKQCTRTHSGENSPNEEHVHIGCIAIRVVQGEMEPDNKEKAVKELVETRNTERDKEDRATPLTPVKPFRQTNENAVQPVQHMTHDVFSLGSSNQSSKMTDSSETTREEDETHQQSCILEATVDDANNTKIQATEEDYFQFQGVTERHQELNNARLDGAGIQSLPKEHTEELGVPRASASGDVTSLPSEKVSVNTKLSSQQETKQVTNTDKVVDNARKTTMESDSATSESKSKSDKSELDSKKNIRLFPESQSNQRVTIEMGEDIQILKQAPQNTFHASGKERQSVRDSYTTRNNAVSASKEQPNLKQEAKSKPRVSTVPEISAIADYARLKVIAADDGPDKMQEFPPNKKEGFFPIIQSRHSRRPVFTAETPARQTVSKKTVSVEPELNHKINKEPKHLVFSTMEQDHKRTGMFKLRESVLSDAKTKEKGNAEIRPNPTETSRATPGDFLCCSQATVAGPELTNISQTNTQYSDQHNNSTTTERLKGSEVSTKHMAVPQKDNNSHQQAMFEEMSNREQNRGERSHATVNQAKAKENEEETAAKQRQENTIIQQIKEERTATVESLKREEMRAREREARVARIEEERREKQREAEQRAEEERTAQLLKEKAAQEEIEKKREEMEEKRAAEEERRMKRREERRKKETEERIATQIQEEMKRAKQREEERHAREEEARVAKEAEDKQRDKQRKEDRRVAQIQEERRTAQIEEERREKEEQEETTRREEEIRRVKHREIEQRIKEHEEMRAAELEERMKRKQEEAHRHEERPGESRKDEKQPAPVEADQPFPKHEEQQPFHTVEIEEEQPSQKVEQRKAALMMDALQYYAITSSANSKDKHPRSLVSPQRREESTRQESPLDESLSRPHAPSSPAPVPPRSTTSSPAPGPKPMMFRVKDNTLRASSLTKPVKPRLHKSFGEDFRVGSPQGDRRGSDRAEEEQVRARRSTGTPIHQDTVTRSNRHPSVKKSPPPQPQPPSFVPEPPAARAEYRPFSRRSMALDEEDSRSCISYMSEDVESFATSAADLADFRGFGEYDRPGSACSFSSDVSRSLGKPPSVPPKSDMALKRAQRLTTRRVKKELTKTPEEGPGPEENALRTPASSSSSSASELRSSYRHARASPHCSAPFSLSHAPASRAPSPRAEMPVANRYPHASPHAIGSVTSPHSGGPVSSPHAAMPVSIPVASPHATAPISFPVSSQHVAAPASLPLTSPRHALPASLPVAPQTIASTASSPVLRRRATPTGPVKQYHVEPGYSQSYPLTQPKVLQDPGSGQYYVVDMPVQVKTKTFFDPETGNYVQLNVRQSAHGGFRPLPQHTGYPQPQIPRLHVLSPARLYPQEADPGESYVVYPGYPPGPQSMPVSTLPPQRSFSGMSIPETLPQAPQSASQNYGYRSYNSEETPYMDTAYKTGTIYDANKVHHPSDKRPEGETPAPSGLQPHIITMSELEDFMDVSDW